MKFKISDRVRRLGPAAFAFVMVGTGTYIGFSRVSGSTTGDHLVATLVVRSAHGAGTSSEVVKSDVQVKMMAESSRANGALSSLGQIPSGVLAYPHAAGQQLLAASFAPDVVRALGANYVALSVRLDPQRWVGPLQASGANVNVFDVEGPDATQVATGAVILKSPETTSLDPKEGVVVSLAVPRESVAGVLAAAQSEHLWLVGK